MGSNVSLLPYPYGSLINTLTLRDHPTVESPLTLE